MEGSTEGPICGHDLRHANENCRHTTAGWAGPKPTQPNRHPIREGGIFP
jgi:hypothetical protein